MVDDCYVEVGFYNNETKETNWINSAINGGNHKRLNSEIAKFAAMGYSTESKRPTRVVKDNVGVIYTFGS